MTFNQQYFDATLRHQIDLLRYGAGVARKVNELLDATRADMKRQLVKRLGDHTGIKTGESLKRLADVERAVDQIRNPAWNDVAETWRRESIDVALDEPLFIEGTLTSLLPVELDLVAPSEAALRALVTKRPFQGKLLKEWTDSCRRADITRIHQQIRIGMVQGEGAVDIARRVFGDKGAMSITRHQAEAVTRTVINHVSNAAQQEFLRENSDLFEFEQLVATLDSRTTPVCQAQDGKQYPVGQGPIPPLHVACRSIRVATLDGTVIGARPFKAGTEKQMLREYGEQNGLGAITNRDQLPRGHKGQFDSFSRRRMRELTGQVPARRTYQEWLSRQTPEFQDDVLGPTRGALFRDGGVKLEKFVNRAGDELTLQQIRERNREAWEKAGLERERQPKPREPDRRRQPAPVPEAPAANDTAPPTPRPAEPAPPRTLRDLARDMDTELELQVSTTRGQQDAVLRGLDKVVQADSLVPPLRRLRLIGKLGLADDALPEFVGGDYNSSSHQVRISTRDETNNAFLRRMVLNPKDVTLPLNTQNVAANLEGVVEMTAVHEYGHHMHMSLRKRTVKDGALVSDPIDEVITRAFFGRDQPPQYVSEYSKENELEFWAESLTAYHYYPTAWMRERAPRTLDMVEQVLKLMEKP